MVPNDVKVVRVPRRAVTYLTADELEQFVGAIRVQFRTGKPDIHGMAFRTLVEVLAATGMRISEALALDIQAVNWKEHEAKVIGKGNKERAVYFNDRAMRWLRRYLELRSDRNPALFANARSRTRMTRFDAERRCRKVRQKTEIQKTVTLHVLRHTFATTLLKNGCPIGHIQGLLGHERLETTCR